MEFPSFLFLGFLIAAVLLCRALQSRPPMGRLALGLCCAVFYLSAGWAGFAVLCVGVCVTAASLRILQGDGPKRKRAVLLAAAWHIAVLLAFKYTGFFTAGEMNFDWAPLGLSFFTFQQLWLLRDAYTRRYLPQSRDLFLHAFFFPAVSSGPILRSEEFFPQLQSERFLRPDAKDVSAGLYALCVGLGKKVLLANSFAVVVDNGWAHLADLTAPAAWLVILGYTLQLYFDFSGYCDMAAGVARLLGVRLPVNFDSPYLAKSVTEFWKRWHITLTTFLRECVYFPLGGSRGGTMRTCLNIMVVFLLSGFWHGAGWTFLLWGALHGLAQITERLLGARREQIPAPLRWAATFLFLNLAWVFFRAPTVAEGFCLLGQTFSGGGAEGMLPVLAEGLFSKEASAVHTLLPTLEPWTPLLRIASLYAAGMVAVFWKTNAIQKMDTFRPTVLRAAALAVLGAWSILSLSGVTAFIYSNF